MTTPQWQVAMVPLVVSSLDMQPRSGTSRAGSTSASEEYPRGFPGELDDPVCLSEQIGGPIVPPVVRDKSATEALSVAPDWSRTPDDWESFMDFGA